MWLQRIRKSTTLLIRVDWKCHRNPGKMYSNDSSEVNVAAVKVSKHHDGFDESSLEMPSRSKMKMNSNDSSAGKGVAVKESK